MITTEFKLVFDEKYHMMMLGVQYENVSEPKQVTGGWEYTIKEYKL